MADSYIRNRSKQLNDKNRQQNSADMSIREVRDSIRETRQGYRGTGMYQLSRYYAQEGLLVIGMGGPPTVGQ